MALWSSQSHKVRLSPLEIESGYVAHAVNGSGASQSASSSESRSSKTWLYLALGAMIALAFANFALGRSVVDVPNNTLPLGQVGMMGVGFVACCTLLTTVLLCYSKETRRTLMETLDVQKRRTSMVAFCAGLLGFIGLFCLTSAFAVDSEGAAVTVAISSGAAIIAGVLCYFLFGELLSRVEITGMLVAIAGVILMAVVNAASSGPLAPILGLLTMLFFGLTNVLQKYVGRFMTCWYSSVFFFAGNAFLGLLVLFVHMGVTADGGRLRDTSSQGAGLAFLGGILLCLGMFFAMGAFERGPAGPIAAIGQNNSIVLLLLQWSILGQVPQTLAIVGLFIAALGIVILALGSQSRKPSSAGVSVCEKSTRPDSIRS